MGLAKCWLCSYTMDVEACGYKKIFLGDLFDAKQEDKYVYACDDCRQIMEHQSEKAFEKLKIDCKKNFENTQKLKRKLNII